MTDPAPPEHPAATVSAGPSSDATARIRPRRRITGISAVLLPCTADRRIDWSAFESHVIRTLAAGLTPAVNMDTGYVQLLDRTEINEVLDRTAALSDRSFVAGAYVADATGDRLDIGAYASAATAIAERGGTPVVFPSHGLNALDDDGWVAAHIDIARHLDRFIGFELGAMFVPHGRIYSLDAYRGLLGVTQCIGAKHSSLSRRAEWDRLALRDAHRPDFSVFTGNDLAIDMVMYGSDYLLGLSTFAPEAFAARDRLWEQGDDRFHELNDLLQYLGRFTFRAPVPAYRHDAAMFFHLRGWADSDLVPAGAVERPAWDRTVLADIVDQLGEWT